ncbi:MAG TPA: sigma factor [Streptosporangiaceae bacterium]|jgi:DNA-directed RNA polymerase specialized sigma subunit
MRSLPVGNPRRDAACTKLITRHAQIVRSCAHRYRGLPEFEDLMQVGYVGLLKAISNFDPHISQPWAPAARWPWLTCGRTDPVA